MTRNESTILVTGATGTVGSEVVKHVAMSEYRFIYLNELAALP